MEENGKKTRIVILGGGFGGAYCAQRLEKKLGAAAEIVILDRHNYFIFYPLLVEAGVGSLEPRHVVVPIRRFLSRPHFIMGEVTGLDREKQEVIYRAAEHDEDSRLRYDHLVIAIGSVTRWPDIPGLKQYARGLKSMSDSVGLRDRAIRMLEAANATEEPERRRAYLHMIVVGANYTGVEVAGEFLEFMRTASRYYANVSPRECSVTLVEIADRILPALDKDLAEYAADNLKRRGMDIRLGTSITEVTAEGAKLKEGEFLRASTVVWAAGIAQNPLAEKLPFSKEKRGFFECERNLRVKGETNVWAIGDCAVNLDAKGSPYPPTAQHATREGKHLADNLARVVSGEEPADCDIKSQGTLAAIGCRTAVARVFGFKVSGFPAWWLFRTVYLMKMPGFGRKVRVALDWTIGLFFRRDYVQLGVHTARGGSPKPD